ncbi:hypothetical protein BDF20DRAFT_915625 [Mycotypha africana]|uniref:uncharacterized protein n=1 Tax=Mycotypha africana TaxID=64632 RepID=UPI00230179AA|nr:uncharacterized protein BDF20DRAFT_915625 [Mycotypha africana]KAI8971873.1 hypothetical protein BDF20DRAFT_915625 [Mycotypha africana]
MAGKGVVRSIKNLAKGFSDVQIKVREATSNDPWGPSGTLMNEIAQLTYNESDFIEIMDMIDKRLNDKGKNWRHVFKALLLLDYCLHVGSENVVLYAKENVYVVKTLKEFQHIDDTGKDVGANVRQKAKDITNLLMDDARLKEERRSRQGMRDRMASVGEYLNDSMRLSSSSNGGNNVYDEERDLKRALAESKRLAQEEERNRRQTDDDLKKALELSQQEILEKERKERERLERENMQQLFGNSNNNSSIFVSNNNPYQQQQQQQQPQQPLQLEWAQPQQPANQGFLNNPYSSSSSSTNQFNTMGLQAQMTGFIPQQQQPQLTGFVPQQPMMTGTNPFSQFSQPQPQQQLPAQQQYDYSQLNFGGGMMNRPPQPQPTQSTPLFNSNTPNFGINSSSGSMSATASPLFSNSTSAAPQQQQPKPQDTKYAKLNALLANNEDGLDTFGNQGNLRIPYGSGFASTLKPTPTGSNNPFGTITNNASTTTNSASQKSLLDLMQEQKLQQQQQQQQQQQPFGNSSAFNTSSSSTPNNNFFF